MKCLAPSPGRTGLSAGQWQLPEPSTHCITDATISFFTLTWKSRISTQSPCHVSAFSPGPENRRSAEFSAMLWLQLRTFIRQPPSRVSYPFPRQMREGGLVTVAMLQHRRGG